MAASDQQQLRHGSRQASRINDHRFRIAACVALATVLGGCTSSSSPQSAATPITPPPAEGAGGHQAPAFSPASPGTFIVNSEADDADALQGDGRCATSEGVCTLRAAVQESNATLLLRTSPLTRTNVIILPAGHYRFINPPLIPTVVAEGTSSEGMLSILGSTNIRGAGARKSIIDGNQVDRVFGVGPNAILSIADVTITGGTGSGIFNQGVLTVTRVTVTGNRASSGGGIFNTPTSSAIIDSSTISNNVAENEGGGIRFDAAGLVINSTITGNSIESDCCTGSEPDGGTVGEGGGIDARGGGPVTIINSTITHNHAATGGGGVNIATSYQGDPGGVFDALGNEVLGGPVELLNTIIANNTSDFGPQNCKHTVAGIYSYGGNIASDDSCGLNASNDRPVTDAQLAPLANNGGPTDTQVPLPGSPAARNGLARQCPALDQRGGARGTSCDSGAVEVSTP